MKKLFLISILFIISVCCYSEPKFNPFYKNEYVKSDYNSFVYDSLYASLLSDEKDVLNGYYYINTETFDIKKHVATRYYLFFKNKDVLSNYLLELQTFDKTISCPTFKDYLEKQTKEELGLFKYIDSEIKVFENTISKVFYYLYVKDLNQE